jgi:(S)-2-hydroxyglutarate dehydrogenase
MSLENLGMTAVEADNIMYNYIIIGGGIVGLATAYAIREKDPDASMLLLEKESGPAQHQTGRNSGVIHSGVYYPPGSLKAKLATLGRKRIVEFCNRHDIPYDICGKIIVATDEFEMEYLHTLEQRGKANGLNVSLISREEMLEKEPHVNGLAALFVPEAGIVSFKKIAAVLSGELQSSGVEILYDHKVTKVSNTSKESVVSVSGREFRGQKVINCGGLHSDVIAARSGAIPEHRIVPFRGEYYELIPEKRYLVNHLIYPVPNPSFPFLGVHFTRMIDGSIHAGPNAVLSLKREGYFKYSFSAMDTWSTLSYKGFWKLASIHWKEGFNEFYRSLSKAQFVKSLQKLIPEVTAADLVPSSAGVRAQALNPDGSLVQDFLIQHDGNTTHIFNAPSPAATSSLEIGRMISEKVIQPKKEKNIVL